MASANQSHTGKPQEKKGGKRQTFLKQKASSETSGLSVSLAGLMWRDIKEEDRMGRELK